MRRLLFAAPLLALATAASAQEPPILQIVPGGAAGAIAGVLGNAQRFLPPDRPIGDLASPGMTNTFLGGFGQFGCASTGFMSISNTRALGGSGGPLPCYPDSLYPHFAAGLAWRYNLTAIDCIQLRNLSRSAVANTDIPSLQSVQPRSGIDMGVSGGVCAGNGAQLTSFVGELPDGYHLFDMYMKVPEPMCPFLINLCIGGPHTCSCGTIEN